MGNQIPIWILYLSYFSTPAIALLAIVIAIVQWRTAHQRAVFDLFEHRMKIYDSAVDIVAEVVREGTANYEQAIRFARTTNRSKFLFGIDVQNYLEETRLTIVKLSYIVKRLPHVDGERYQNLVNEEAELLNKISDFFSTFPIKSEPYLRMHQKAPPF